MVRWDLQPSLGGVVRVFVCVCGGGLVRCAAGPCRVCFVITRCFWFCTLSTPSTSPLTLFSSPTHLAPLQALLNDLVLLEPALSDRVLAGYRAQAEAGLRERRHLPRLFALALLETVARSRFGMWRARACVRVCVRVCVLGFGKGRLIIASRAFADTLTSIPTPFLSLPSPLPRLALAWWHR